MWPFKTKPNPFQVAIKTHLDDDFTIFAAGKDAPTEDVIEQFERSIGFLLPKDFRAYSSSAIGGIYVEAKEAIWPREKKIAPFWTFLYGLHVYGFSKEIPDSMNLRIQTEQFRQETNSTYVPCLKRLMDPDIYCFDQDGRIRRWDHETGEAVVQNQTFTEVFVSEVAELRKRKDRMISERQSSQGKS